MYTGKGVNKPLSNGPRKVADSVMRNTRAAAASILARMPHQDVLNEEGGSSLLISGIFFYDNHKRYGE